MEHSIMRVVIVDDEPSIIRLISHMLDPALATAVGIALNGIEGYARVVEHRPDILITDVRMPGYSGLQLIEKVKQTAPDTDIIVISGYREFDYLQSILCFGVQEFLLKPVEGEELNSSIRRIRQKRAQQDDYSQYVRSMEANLSRSYERLREEYTLKVFYEGGDCLRRDNLPEDLFSFRDGNYCVALLKADCAPEAMESQTGDMPYVRTLLERYRDTIVTSFRAECHDIACAAHGNKVYFIFNYPADLSEREFWTRPAFNAIYIGDMLETENHKYSFLRFTLGIGISVDGLACVRESMRSALEAVGNRLNTHSGVVYGKRVQRSDDAAEILDSDRRSRIAATVAALDDEKLMQVFEEMAQVHSDRGDHCRIFELADATLEFVKSIVIANGLLSEAEYADLPSPDEHLDNCYTLKLVLASLSKYFAALMCRIREIRDTRASKPIRIALDYMRENYASPITLKSVAEVIFYSPNYFSNAFKSQTGMTFLDCLTQLRMEAAQELLKCSAKTIGEIAHDVGYTDEKYFSRLFVKAVGAKPTEFRKFYS